MTRKDYTLIAYHLADSRLDMAEIEGAMAALFPAFEADNPRFDRDRFRDEVWKVRDLVMVERTTARNRELAEDRLYG